MTGIKRLEEMIKGQKDKYLIKIVDYLKSRIELDKYFLNEEKNLKGMSDYIKNLARKRAKNGVAVIEDETVYKWAVDYFIKTDKELGLESNKKTTEVRNIEKVEGKDPEDEFGSIFEDDNSKKIEDEENDIEQISLF